LEKLPTLVDTIKKVQPDGVIVADPGVFKFVSERAPELSLHVSTQANVCSSLSVSFWQDQGASLCVLAREVSFQELKEIREECPGIMLEAFVHGSMCMTYSGRCLLSNFMAERGANQGNCAHSCRWNYKVHARLKDGTLKEIELNEHNAELFEFLLEEQCRPGELMPIEEDSRGSYIMNSKDLCLMPKLSDFLELGIDSLKVEGRNKSLYYLAIVTRAYRMAIDDWYQDPENWNPERYMEELYTIPNRGYTLAFHDGRLSNHAHNFENEKSLSAFEFAGIITAADDEGVTIHVRNKLVAGDVVEFVSPQSRETILLRVYQFDDPTTGKSRETVHGGANHYFKIPYTAFDREDPAAIKERLVPMTVLRKDRELIEQHRQRVSLDIISQNVELNRDLPTSYDTARDELHDLMQGEPMPSRYKAARLGKEGCCGKGCNGCLIFTHDPAYERARELYKRKKIGEKLSQDMREAPL
jgi:putative protease